MELQNELTRYLDTLTIHSDNIGDIRRSCFVPWESAWNGIVRDETAAREVTAAPSPAPSADAERYSGHVRNCSCPQGVWRAPCEEPPAAADAPAPLPSTFVLHTAAHDPRFRKWMIEQLQAMGDKIYSQDEYAAAAQAGEGDRLRRASQALDSAGTDNICGFCNERNAAIQQAQEILRGEASDAD